MSLAQGLELAKILVTETFQPCLEQASGSCLVNDLGLINFRTFNNPAELIYRKKNNPGGTLTQRLKGEDLKVSSTGISYVDEKAGTVKFGDAEEVLLSDVLGYNNPNAAKVFQDPMTITEIARRQFEVLMTKLNNTARSLAALRFVREITLSEGNPIVNNSIDITVAPPVIGWDNITTAKPIYDLIKWREEYFGTNIGAQAMTVLMPAKQISNLLRNAQVAQQIGLTRISDPSAQVVVSLAQLNSVLAAHNIRIYEWSEGYYTKSDSSFKGQLTQFLNPNQITLIPGSYSVRNQNTVTATSQVMPGSSTAPFVDLIMVPDSGFVSKIQSPLGSGTGILQGNLTGAYFYTGIPVTHPGHEDTYVSAVAVEMGAYTPQESSIKSIQVQA